MDLAIHYKEGNMYYIVDLKGDTVILVPENVAQAYCREGYDLSKVRSNPGRLFYI